MIDFNCFPSPCYIMEEELLRKNLALIKSVSDGAGEEHPQFELPLNPGPEAAQSGVQGGQQPCGHIEGPLGWDGPGEKGADEQAGHQSDQFQHQPTASSPPSSAGMGLAYWYSTVPLYFGMSSWSLAVTFTVMPHWLSTSTTPLRMVSAL